MTERDVASQLRAWISPSNTQSLNRQAADLIESQAAEIERLKAKVAKLEYWNGAVAVMTPLRAALVLAWLASVAGASLWAWGLGYDVSLEERHEANHAQSMLQECLRSSSHFLSQTERATEMMRHRPAVEWVVQRAGKE